MSHELLEAKIEEFLRDDEKDQYWRAVELHEELVGPGDEQLLEVKEILEGGVKHGLYKRKIVTKKKVMTVGYQFKRLTKAKAAENITSGNAGGEEGWERK